MSYIVTSNNNKHAPCSFIYENLAPGDYTGVRDVDNLIGIIAKLLEYQSRLLETLFEKQVITEHEVKQILNRFDF